MNESLMQAVIMDWAMEQKHHEIVMPNLKALTWRWEADLISVTRAYLIHEYEIKISRSDFLADANKRSKHRFFNEHKSGKYDWSRKLPNYFWYAISGFEVTEDELPEYAGLMRVVWNDYQSRWRKPCYIVEVKKNAPRLHGEKMAQKDRKSMSRWLSYKLKNEYARQFPLGEKAHV